MKVRFFLGIFYLLTGFCTFGQDSEGILPRGKTVGPGNKFILPQPRKTQASCRSSIASMMGGNGFFNRLGNQFYYLARLKSGGKATGKQFVFLKMDTQRGVLQKLLSFKLTMSGAILPHGDPVNAISLFTFKGGNKPCLMGKSRIITINFSGEYGTRKSSQKGHYRIVDAEKGRVLADLKSASLRILDVATLQSRRLASFPKNEIPLYYGEEKVFTLQNSKQPAILRYRPGPKLDGKLKLVEGYKVIRHKSKFGIVGNDAGQQTIFIGEIKGWSGTRTKKHKLVLPEGLSFNEMGIAVSFSNQVAIVYGSTDYYRKNWRRALVYDYREGKLLKDFTAPPGNYVGDVALSPDEGLAVFIIKSGLDESLAGISVFDLESRRWRRIHLSFSSR